MKIISLLALATVSIALSSCYSMDDETAIRNSTAQGPTGSPHIGLIPTMKKIAE